MRKPFIVVLALLVLGGLVALISGPLLDRVSRAMADRLIERMAGGGFRIESVRFARVTWRPPFSVIYRGIRGQVHVGGESGFGSERHVAVVVDRAQIRLTGLRPIRLAVDLDGISAVASPVGEAPDERLAAAELLTSGRGTIVLSGGSGRPVDWVRETIAGFLRGVMQGDLPEGSRLSGQVEFSVGSHWHTAQFFTLVSKEGTRLVLNREDVALIGAGYDQPLTEAEIDLVALYPLRAPVLLRIKQKASREAVRLSQAVPSLPADAFRHVLWSYLLTLEFGEVFAEEVTDAHEIGATYESGRANREMDLTNNGVGRRYAVLKVKEADLVDRVLNDPAVVWSPADLE